METLLQGILQFFGGAAKVLVWFISAVVIPLTVWITFQRDEMKTLRKDVNFNYAEQIRFENEIETRRLQDQKRFDEIMVTLGRMEGELKRIR